MKNHKNIAGWHYIYCCFCGKKNTKITHFGGTKKLKVCSMCFKNDGNKMPCFNCFLKIKTKRNKKGSV